MTKLENYLRDVRDARSTGEAVKETSFYPALSNLLNGVGAELNPKVRAVINLKNRGDTLTRKRTRRELRTHQSRVLCLEGSR